MGRQAPWSCWVCRWWTAGRRRPQRRNESPSELHTSRVFAVSAKDTPDSCHLAVSGNGDFRVSMRDTLEGAFYSVHHLSRPCGLGSRTVARATADPFQCFWTMSCRLSGGEGHHQQLPAREAYASQVPFCICLWSVDAMSYGAAFCACPKFW